MSSEQPNKAPAVIFKGPGFYITDSRTDELVEPIKPGLQASLPTESSHSDQCGCGACHPDHGENILLTSERQGQKNSPNLSASHSPQDALPEVHVSSAHSEQILVPEILAEKKYIPLTQLGPEYLPLGSVVPVAEVVMVSVGGKFEPQARVGFAFTDPATSLRVVRVLSDPTPLTGFQPIPKSTDLATRLALEFKNFQDLERAIQFDGPGVLASHFYANLEVFRSHDATAANHLVTGISTTLQAVEMMRAQAKGNTRTILQARQKLVGLGGSGSNILHGLHDGIPVSAHEQAQGVRTVTYTAMPDGQFLNPQGSPRSLYAVMTKVVPDGSPNTRLIQNAVSRVGDQLALLRAEGISTANPEKLVVSAIQKMAGSNDQLFEPGDDGVLHPAGSTAEFIRDLAEVPTGNQYLPAKLRGGQ